MIRLLVLISLLCCFGCKQKKVEKPSNDFESLMGSALPAWKHVQTKEDFENLAFFKSVYENNILFLKEEMAGELKIPKVLHFIWIGPKPFPRTSIENVRTWIGHNPDWKVKFWTDRARPLPHPDMEVCYIKDFTFRQLEREFNASDNYGEKSDVLRYEILFQEGGVYADHDVKCLKNFTPLNKAYDFYCGLEVPFPTSLSSSVLPTNNLVGSRAGHPLLAKMMDWLEERWDQIEADYPGQDRDAIINRVSHRTFLTLGENFKIYGNKYGNVDIALPSFYFNSPKIEWALFAQHQYDGTWFNHESKFERTTRHRLMMMSKKVNKLLLAIGVLAGLNLIGFGAVGFLIARRRT